MLSTVVLSNENQTCRGWEVHTSTGGGGCHGCIIVEWQAVLRLDSGKEVKYMDSCDSAGRSMICGGSKKILTWLNVDFIFSYA